MTQREKDEIRALVLSFSTRISDLPEIEALADSDYITVVQDDGTKKHSKKATLGSLVDLIKIYYPDGNGAKLQGVAHPTDNNVRLPIGTNGFWFAIEPGLYKNYGNILVGETPKLIYYNVVTEEWSSEDLWGELGGTIGLKLENKDGKIITKRIPVIGSELYTFGYDAVPSGSLGNGVITEFDKERNILATHQFDTNPKTITTNKDTIKVDISFVPDESNPAEVESCLVTMSAYLHVLVEALYNNLIEDPAASWEEDIIALRNGLASLTIATDRIAAQVEDLEGNMALLEITAQQILARVNNNEGDIAQLYIRADEIGTRVENAEGDISTIIQRADSITAQVENIDGDVATLKITAQEISSSVQNMQGDISNINQKADSISASVENINGDISRLEMTAQSITSTVQNLQGDVSIIQQTSSSITSRVEDIENNISVIEQTSSSIIARVTDVEGSVGTLEVTATQIQSSVQNLEGDISTLTQRADSISARVENVSGEVSQLTITANEIRSEVSNLEGDISTISQKADSIEMSVENMSGDMSRLELRADTIEASVSSVSGDIAALSIRADAIESDVRDANNNISTITQTATEIQSTVQNQQGQISTLTQTAEGLESRVSDSEGHISVLTQTSQSLESRIYDNENNISSITQTVGSIEQRVQSSEGVISTLTTDLSGITARVTNAEGNISQLQIDTDSIDLMVQSVSTDLTNYKGTVNSLINGLQDQIDGVIETWYAEGVPTLSNYPANQWTDTDTKNNHIGDLYYDKVTGKAYRFMYDESASQYVWVELADADIAKALALAGQKKRIFSGTPTAPYDINDLWIKDRTVNIAGSSVTVHEIYKCVRAREAGETIDLQNDWIPADDYSTTVNRANLQILTDAIIGTVGSYTFNADGTLDTATQSRIQQTADAIRLSVVTGALDEGGEIYSALLATGIDIVDGDITLTANHILLQNQSAVSGLELTTVGTGANQRVVIDIDSLNINGIFTTQAWQGKETLLKGYADSAASDAQSAAEGTAQTLATNALNSAKAYANSTEYLTDYVVPLISDATNGLAHESDYNYLKAALLDGTTTVAGGLILSSLIKLGYNAGTTQNPSWVVMSGINGIASSSETGYGIAAWYGGPMVDLADVADDDPIPSHAATLFRMDGSGYLADGAISWGAAGDLHLLDNVYIGPNMDHTLSSISTFVTLLSTWFEDDTITIDGVQKHVLRVNMDGDTHDTGFAGVVWNGFLITEGDQITGSLTPGGGGGGTGGAGYLYELNDVNDNLLSPAVGTMIYWSGTEWVRTSASSPSNGNILQYNNGAWNYVSASSIGGVTSVVGQTGSVGVEQIASALTTAGYKLTDTVTTTLALSAITGATNLQAIEALTGNGLLKRTNGTWSFDNNEYITEIDRFMIEDALGYTPLEDSDLDGYATEAWVTNKHYITGIDASDIETALDYIPIGVDDLKTLTLTVNNVQVGTYNPANTATLNITPQNITDAIGNNVYHPYGGGAAINLAASAISARTVESTSSMYVGNNGLTNLDDVRIYFGSLNHYIGLKNFGTESSPKYAFFVTDTVVSDGDFVTGEASDITPSGGGGGGDSIEHILIEQEAWNELVNKNPAALYFIYED